MLDTFGFTGAREGKDWYIYFAVGNDYNVGTRDGTLGFIPERFPLLTDLVKSWGSGQIRREIGREAKPFEGVAFAGGRDQILITELARRGLSPEEISDLLADVKPIPEEYKTRLQSVVGGYIQSGKGPWLDVFQPALKAYEAAGSVADEAMFDLFGRAANQGGPATTEQQGLDILKKGVFWRGPLGYLAPLLQFARDGGRVEALGPRDEAFEKLRALTIAMIRQRISSPRRRLPIKPQAK